MLRKTMKIAGVVTLLGVVGALVLGPSRMLSLVRAGRSKIRESTREWVDPAAELEATSKKVLEDFPKAISRLRVSIQEASTEETRQRRSIGELTDAAGMIDDDLKILATGVGRGCELHGRDLSAAECEDLAIRLHQGRQRYADDVRRRTVLVEKL